MQPLENAPRRKQHIINGRRVSVRDLINALLLQPGQELIFERPRVGNVHRAVVTERGRIRLADGQEFNSPSGAADAVAGVATDGWMAWQVGEGGPYLSQLRRQLLESVAEEVAATDAEPAAATEQASAIRRYEELNAARERAQAGTPEELTVRDLIRRWGAQEREREVINQIEADLANHGLVTVPDFRAVGLESMVTLTVPPDPDEVEEPEAAPAVPTAHRPTVHMPVAVAGNEESDDIGLTLGNVLPRDHQLVSVPPSASLKEAITQMLMRDFSQIPVLRGERDLRGVVTWQSIAIARQTGTEASLSDAMIAARDFSYDTRLLDVVEVLLQEDFVFVRAHDKRVYGIVTAADVVRVYYNMATPFFLIGELDQELRRLIRNRFEIEELRRVCVSGTGLQSFDDMTMGDYLSVLRNPTCWEKLGWDLDRKVVGDHLDEIRKIRNKVAHFNPDPPSAHDVDRLRNFLKVIRTFDK